MWENIVAGVEKVNDAINGVVWGWPVIILILGTGILLTIRTRALQVTHFGESLNTTIVPTLKGLGKKKAKDGRLQSVSQFEAFSTAISGTVGTGNIIGVVSAILTGGPGAVFWMWISAFFGMVTNYSENVLGLYYRKKDQHGNLSGGAFYYIAYGLKWKWLGYLAAIFCMFAAVGMSGVQTNKISGTLAEAFARATASHSAENVRLIVGIVVAVITAVVIIGGIKRIGKVASMLVPFMSLLFIVMALIAIFLNVKHIPNAFALIFSKAFNFKAAGGGILGYSFSQVIKKGMARGVFSNEAGLGSSVIAHSASETREPVKQGLWGVFEVFFDSFIICTLTAIMFLTTFDLNTLSLDKEDSVMSMTMFSTTFGGFGTAVFSVILPLFAFTTVIAWSYYDPQRPDLGDRRHLQRPDGRAQPDLPDRAQRSGGEDHQKLLRPQKGQGRHADAFRLPRYERGIHRGYQDGKRGNEINDRSERSAESANAKAHSERLYSLNALFLSLYYPCHLFFSDSHRRLPAEIDPLSRIVLQTA